MTKRQGEHGFTVLEMLLVVVVIVLLAAVVYSTYAGVRRNQRNQERRHDIQDIYQQLEAYDVENGKYPTLTDLNNAGWRGVNMKTLSLETFRDPSGKSSDLAAKPTKNAYAYEVTAADGSICDNKNKPCAHYTLTATLEGTNAGTFVKSSLN